MKNKQNYKVLPLRDRIQITYQGAIIGWFIGTMLQAGHLRRSEITQLFERGEGLNLVFGLFQIISVILGIIAANALLKKFSTIEESIMSPYDSAWTYLWLIGLFGVLGGALGNFFHWRPIVFAGVVGGVVAAPFIAKAYIKYRTTISAK